MEDEVITPDFDIGITDYENEKDAWQSDSDSVDNVKQVSEVRDREQDCLTDDHAEEADKKFAQQIKNIFKTNEPRVSVPRTAPRKRRRVSRSKARVLTGREALRGKTSGAPVYTCPTRIAGIFDKKISPEALCTLSAIKHGSPDMVREIIPRATVDQICQVVKPYRRSKISPNMTPVRKVLARSISCVSRRGNVGEATALQLMNRCSTKSKRSNYSRVRDQTISNYSVEALPHLPL